ncbi:MAG: hypothetical protein KatS3mg021_1248 [Fimbriimonadales bacterium]|jgi:hypothetical protein|nr:MAG: hypothetical protein KatS3mg021_1248 [Fimbriimonadales bacterium]
MFTLFERVVVFGKARPDEQGQAPLHWARWRGGGAA